MKMNLAVYTNYVNDAEGHANMTGHASQSCSLLEALMYFMPRCVFDDKNKKRVSLMSVFACVAACWLM